MYQLVLSRKVEKFLAEIQKTNSKLFGQFMQGFENISSDPACAKALLGNLKGYYSYRVRDYRIVFDIDNQRLIVHIEKIEHRKNVYK
ncbi:MAG: type II toxin-antitoxin system RelE/ParE family toxin [Candidatus Schekmanbacteria bacterium]|nr:type II toxin-antitoxin system RelE/ParE family toxin [Candidatus Schekmanbacteria bacterium]